MITFVYGDVHGSHDQLVELLERCRRFAGRQPHKHVFLGDYVDRGPDSRSVIETIIGLQEKHSGEAVAVLGNHEMLLLQADNFIDEAIWIDNGGAETLRSYGANSTADLPERHLQWLRSLPLTHDDGQRLFVHAGIRPGVPLDQQIRNDLLEIREPFLSSTADHGRLIVHGHTPTRDGKPDIRPNRVNLDTGAVFGRSLTAAVFDDATRDPLEFLQVS